MNSFWSTWEVYCITADFQYEQYLAGAAGAAAPLCKDAFKALARVIDIQMEKDLTE